MTGANCYWALLRQDGSGTLEIATANAASTFTALALQRVSSSGEAPCDDGDEDKKTQQLQQLFHRLDAALRGFLASSRCLTRDSERYSVEARSLASSGSFDAAFNFLGRALEAAAISKAMSELEASRAAGMINNESSSSSSSAATAAASASLAAASVSATTAAFSSHVARCAESARALGAVRRAAPAAYAVLSQVMTAKAAAPPPPVPLFTAVGGGASSVTFAAAVAAAAAATKPPNQKPERPQRSPLTDALRDRLKALAAGAGCLPTWPPRGASSSALLC